MYDTPNGFNRRTAFSDGDLDTASPARVLIKCFDRLDADLDRGLAAIEAADFEVVNAELGHAQDLLGEVAGMLDVDAWDQADSLLAIYDYVLRLLAAGSMLKAVGPISEARHLLAEIGDAFRTASTAEVRAASAALEQPAPEASPSAETPENPAADAPSPVNPVATPVGRSGGFSVLA